MIEATSGSWARMGFEQAKVAEMAARLQSKGIDPLKILGDPSALADVAEVLGKEGDIPAAIEALTKPRGAQQILANLGLAPVKIGQAVQQMRYLTAAQRETFLLQKVASSRFRGQGMAGFDTAAGQFEAFHAQMANLREGVGTALIPALTQLAVAMTNMLQGAEQLARPFGGLGQALKTLFLPMVAGGLLLFTNLRGVLGGIA